MMSWSMDVLLLLNLDETCYFAEEEGELVPEERESEALNRVNHWLHEEGYGQLVDLTLAAFDAGDTAMLALVYGGTFKNLEPDDFLKVVFEQNWIVPQYIQLLLKEE